MRTRMSVVSRAVFLQTCLSPLRAAAPLLGIDVGSKKSGFASTPGLVHDATGLGVVRAPATANAGALCASSALLLVPNPFNSRPADAFAGTARQLFVQATLQHLKATRAVGLVVGWPLTPQGAAGPECAAVSGFVSALRSAGVFVPVLLWDETSSSVIARAALRAAAPAQGGGGLAVAAAVASAAAAGAGSLPPAAGTGAAASGGRHRDRPLPLEYRQHVDQLAAVVILNSFLAYARTASGKPVRKQPPPATVL